MRSVVSAILCAALSGCVLISPEEIESRKQSFTPVCRQADGTIADADPWYVDSDGDGFGDPDTEVRSCANPDGGETWIKVAEDCDDSDSTIHPDAQEECDGVDHDCDGSADIAEPPVWYADVDGDGFGDPDVDLGVGCDAPANAASNSADCDDSRADVNPDGVEICNDGVDDNCNGAADEADTETPPTDSKEWFPDSDSDGFGDVAGAQVLCAVPTGSILQGGDCDDADATINPNADEVCDEADHDCDGSDDNGLVYVDYWPDVDGDGQGDETLSAVPACADPGENWSLSDTDCDDTAETTFLGQDEICDNLVDDNCDGGVDELCIPDFPYTPANNIPWASYTQDGMIDFGACAGDFTLTTGFSGVVYSADWINCASAATPSASSFNFGAGDGWVIAARNIIIPTGTEMVIVGDSPVAFLVFGDVDIAGTLFAGATSTEGGPGAGGTVKCDGAGNGGDGSTAKEGPGGGGAGGATKGGIGGKANNGAQSGGAAGSKRSPTIITPFHGGCTGGSGGRTRDTGGFGGGAVQLSAAGNMVITGDVWAGGGGGMTATGATVGDGGGGGGSGGSVLLQADILVLSGQVGANGGGGAGGGTTGQAGDDATTVGLAAGGTAGDSAGAGGYGGYDALTPEDGEDGGSDRSGGGAGGSVGFIQLDGHSGCVLTDSAISPAFTGNCPN